MQLAPGERTSTLRGATCRRASPWSTLSNAGARTSCEATTTTRSTSRQRLAWTVRACTRANNAVSCGLPMSNPPPRTGILLVAHGTVARLAELPAFVARIRHGRPAPPGLVEELSRRYQAIGGSPLLRVTEEQARALETRTGMPVLLGMR